MNTTDSSIARPNWFARAAITTLFGFLGGAIAYPVFMPKPVDVAIQTTHDDARGITCYLTSKGGISCVPDQWFTPPAGELQPQGAVAPSRGLDL